MVIENVLIRDEQAADIPVISQVTVAAFATMEISHHTEQFVIKALECSAPGTIRMRQLKSTSSAVALATRKNV